MKDLKADLQDCKELGERIFAEPWVGKRTDVTYSPLENTNLNPFSQYFLRMSTSTENGTSSAGLEFVEHFSVDGSEKVWKSYFVYGDGIINEETAETARLDARKINVPHVIKAPQMNLCIGSFFSDKNDDEIDAESLRNEILVISDPSKSSSHVSMKVTTNHPVDDYSIDCLYKTHRFPKELGDAIKLGPGSMELLKVVAKYNGKVALSSVMIFDGRGELRAISSAFNDDPVKQIGALASFKRALFN